MAAKFVRDRTTVLLKSWKRVLGPSWDQQSLSGLSRLSGQCQDKQYNIRTVPTKSGRLATTVDQEFFGGKIIQQLNFCLSLFSSL